MTYYLYIPFPRKEISTKLKRFIAQWTSAEYDKGNDIIVTYSGDKDLMSLPSTAKIYVLLDGEPKELVHAIPRESEIPNHFQHNVPNHLHELEFSVDTNSKTISNIVTDMIHDGLLNDIEKSRLRIKLYFLNAGEKALLLAKSFLEALSKYPSSREGHIRIDYYLNLNHQLNPPIKWQRHSKAHKYINNEIEEGSPTTSNIRQSIYNHLESRPKLTLNLVNRAIEKYNTYKSSRASGLSGLLRLNGFFSSDKTSWCINTLLNEDLSDEARFILAKNFLKDNPNNSFAENLNVFIDEIIKSESLYWKLDDEENIPATWSLSS